MAVSVSSCDSAWNKDPVFGVIGIQTGPRERGVHIGFHCGDGSRFWDADSGDDCEDSAGRFPAPSRMAPESQKTNSESMTAGTRSRLGSSADRPDQNRGQETGNAR